MPSKKKFFEVNARILSIRDGPSSDEAAAPPDATERATPLPAFEMSRDDRLLKLWHFCCCLSGDRIWEISVPDRTVKADEEHNTPQRRAESSNVRRDSSTMVDID